MDSSNNGLQRRTLLGFFAHPGTIEDYLNLISTSVSGNEKCTVFYHNLHSLYTYFTSKTVQKLYEGTTVLVDGMPVIWLYNLFGAKLSREHRITYVDFIIPVMQHAADNNWKVFHVGQDEQMVTDALAVIREKVPGVEINGHHGYFEKEPQCNESLKVIEEINDFGAQLLFVGFGSPTQELWLDAHRDQINANVVFCAGACMEYVAGAVKTPPRWMGRVGLEWSFRLIENPRRFAFRYLVEPILLFGILAFNGIKALLTGKRISQ